MANMYGTTCSSSSEPDDFSLFLHQILLRSSSSTSSNPELFAQQNKQMQTHLPPENQNRPQQSSVQDHISAAESSRLHLPPSLIFSPTGDYFPVNAANVSSSSVGTIDNDPDEYDCESEEGIETLVEEASEKRSRNSSKRSRAAEVHNLSEKRRRSRINEKMKALQKLIPNSNKTDKASMLDEAIEYLKQLQLQVQMLTMRNGLSLYPMCLPGVLNPSQLSHTRMGFSDASGSFNLNMTTAVPFNQDPSRTSLSNMISSKTSFGLEMESPIQALRAPFHHAQEICREDLFPCQQINADHQPLTNLSSRAQTANLDCGLIISCELDGMHPKSQCDGGIKSERPKFG